MAQQTPPALEALHPCTQLKFLLQTDPRLGQEEREYLHAFFSSIGLITIGELQDINRLQPVATFLSSELEHFEEKTGSSLSLHSRASRTMARVAIGRIIRAAIAPDPTLQEPSSCSRPGLPTPLTSTSPTTPRTSHSPNYGQDMLDSPTDSNQTRLPQQHSQPRKPIQQLQQQAQKIGGGTFLHNDQYAHGYHQVRFQHPSQLQSSSRPGRGTSPSLISPPRASAQTAPQISRFAPRSHPGPRGEPSVISSSPSLRGSFGRAGSDQVSGRETAWSRIVNGSPTPGPSLYAPTIQTPDHRRPSSPRATMGTSRRDTGYWLIRTA